MALTPVDIQLELINNKVQFIGRCSNRPDMPVKMDYSPPLGEGDGFLGLELLVMSFAGCVSTAVVAILRKMGKQINGYSMLIIGNKREAPLQLSGLHFTITVEGDITLAELEAVIGKAEQISPVWVALKGNVPVTWETVIKE